VSVEVALCPLCGALQSNLFDRRIAQTQTITNRLCSECGLVYQSPRMSGSELEAFYQEEYRQLYQGDQGPTAKDLKVQSLRASSLLAFAKVRIPAVSRHLDIGCSAGLLLQQFQTAYCSQPAGVEPGAAYRQYARGLGLSVYASLEELRAENQAPFDLVSMAHVLEHIPEPVAYLENLRSNLLAPEGWLLLEVPNLYAHNCFEIAHLVSYSPNTLRQTVQKAGFELLAFKQHGQPRSEIIPLYLTLLARPAADRDNAYPVTPERGVRLKRRLGMLQRQVWTRISPQRAWLSIPAS